LADCQARLVRRDQGKEQCLNQENGESAERINTVEYVRAEAFNQARRPYRGGFQP
jgi:hypothetical protein